MTRAREDANGDVVKPAEECGFCEGGERPIREWSSRAMFHRTLGWEKCPHCDGTGFVQEVR